MKDVTQSDVVVMDFTKAFNKFSHTRLLHKLHIYEIDLETCKWSMSFLCSRTHHVVIGRGASEEVDIMTGQLRQGSVLGSIFFLIYINNMVLLSQTVCWWHHHHIPHHHCWKWLQKSLRRLSSFGEVGGWLTDGIHSWQMLCLQTNQEEDIHRYPYTLHGQILRDETNTKYLMVTIADNMTWNTHIEQIAGNGNKSLIFWRESLRYPHTARATVQIEMVQWWAGRWVKNDYV